MPDRSRQVRIKRQRPFAMPWVARLVWVNAALAVQDIMRQATNLHEVAMPWLLPSITLNTTPADYQPIKQLREMRFNGKTWGPLKEEN